MHEPREVHYCDIAECLDLAHADGLCWAHYQQRIRSGRVTRSQVARRSRSDTWAVVDAAMWALLSMPPEATADDDLERAYKTFRKAVERHGMALARRRMCRDCRRRPHWATR